ncbi:unannotated protein [freshwater metagenome]|uniref:Unannotated protein n=1 Tax=freshwater metagenome TaxID=449393 RepID=A0A6J7I8F2_9ZZZZ
MTQPPDRARLVRIPLAGAVAPHDAPLLVAADAHPVALVGTWAGSQAICTSEPVAFAEEDPFAALDAVPEVDDAVPGAVGGGWIGFLGYGLGRTLEPSVPPAPPRPHALPDHALAYYDHVLRCDADGAWWFEALWTAPRAAALEERLALLRARVECPPAAGTFALGTLRSTGAGLAGHAAAVAQCRRRIAEGDLFEANICLLLEASFDGDDAALAAQVLRELRPSHGAHLGGPWGALVSASPELFLRREGRAVATEPIKGTAPGGTPAEALAASGKDRAENVMIVDLMRNDLGRVCDYGSVTVRDLCAPQATAGVWSLVSRVEGRLRPGVGDGELVRAAFPPGSVTGAPKIQAMRTIHELEGAAREAYTGAIGIASPLAGLELAVTIRTLELAGGRAWMGAGGAVTWPSDPWGEVEECLVKARPVAQAAGSRVASDAQDRAPDVPAAMLVRAARPDPQLGVLTTLRCDDGHPAFAQQHLDRLAAHARALWGVEISERLEALLAGLAQDAGHGSHRLRLRVVPQPGGPAVSGEAVAEPAAPVVVHTLVPVTLPGGLGAHKWCDRRLVDDLSAQLGRVPLLIDLDGSVLEAAWASVFAVEGDALVTPPADGRILPGVCRAVLLAAGEVCGMAVREEPLTFERLARADGVILTSGVRLAGAARLADGTAADADLVAAVRDLLLAASGQPRPDVAIA